MLFYLQEYYKFKKYKNPMYYMFWLYVIIYYFNMGFGRCRRLYLTHIYWELIFMARLWFGCLDVYYVWRLLRNEVIICAN